MAVPLLTAAPLTEIGETTMGQDEVVFWVATTPSLEGDAIFLRTVPYRRTLAGSQFLLAWQIAYAQSQGISLAQGLPAKFRDIQLFRAAKTRLIVPELTLAEQDVFDGEVLVILPDSSEGIIDFVNSQAFPGRIDPDIAGANVQLTWKEISAMLKPPTPSVVNNVTVNLGSNATFTGPFAVGQTISQAYSTSAAASNEDLRRNLERLTQSIAKLVEQIESDSDKIDVSEQLKTFVEQASKEKPSKRLLQVTGEGLIEAAKTVASMAGSITSAVKAVLALFI